MADPVRVAHLLERAATELGMPKYRARVIMERLRDRGEIAISVADDSTRAHLVSAEDGEKLWSAFEAARKKVDASRAEQAPKVSQEPPAPPAPDQDTGEGPIDSVDKLARTPGPKRAKPPTPKKAAKEGDEGDEGDEGEEIPAEEKRSKVPTWLWLVGAGVLALGVVLVVSSRRKRQPEPSASLRPSMPGPGPVNPFDPSYLAAYDKAVVGRGG